MLIKQGTDRQCQIYSRKNICYLRPSKKKEPQEIRNGLFILIFWPVLIGTSTLYLKLINMCIFKDCVINRDYFMESACVRDFHTSWWSIWNRTSEHSERVRFLIQNQRVWKSRTKRFPCSNLFISYLLRFLLFIQL